MFTFIEDPSIRESLKAGSFSVIITLFYLYFFRPNYVLIYSQEPEPTMEFNSGLAINIALFVGCVVSLIVISSSFNNEVPIKSTSNTTILSKFI
jgi:hypothetical protein